MNDVIDFSSYTRAPVLNVASAVSLGTALLSAFSGRTWAPVPTPSGHSFRHTWAAVPAHLGGRSGTPGR